MSLIAIAIATAATVSFAPVDTPKPQGLLLAQSSPLITTQNILTPSADYMTTPEGCTYRRTKAPGYPERWILVLNPHHIGRPNSPSSCKGMM